MPILFSLRYAEEEEEQARLLPLCRRERASLFSAFFVHRLPILSEQLLVGSSQVWVA